jgi:two-component system, NtrC family, response regulator HydG
MMTNALRILVVDDDVDNAHSLGELFEMEGHVPMVVHSGEAAIQAYKNEPFDIAFMDVMMPGLNGVESFMQIRRMRPAAKVFMMTGYSVEELLQQAMSEGAMGVLSKPMDVRSLLSMVGEVGQDGLVVAPGFGDDYAQRLQALISASGINCNLVQNTTMPYPTPAQNNLTILDLQRPLIDTMGYYTSLRKAGHLPTTIIVTPPSGGLIEGREALRDLTVTGILNKPFDPLDLLSRLESLAA